jgi:hypothetical protein
MDLMHRDGFKRKIGDRGIGGVASYGYLAGAGEDDTAGGAVHGDDLVVDPLVLENTQAVGRNRFVVIMRGPDEVAAEDGVAGFYDLLRPRLQHWGQEKEEHYTFHWARIGFSARVYTPHSMPACENSTVTRIVGLRSAVFP